MAGKEDQQHLHKYEDPTERARAIFAGDPSKAMDILHEVTGEKQINDDDMPVDGELNENESVFEESRAQSETNDAQKLQNLRSELLSQEEPEEDFHLEESGEAETEPSQDDSFVSGLARKGSSAVSNILSHLPTSKKADIAGPVEDEQQAALSTLPENQMRQLEGIAQDLLDKTSQGPASLIDQDVIAMLQKLPAQKQDKFFRLILTKNGWRALNAENKEVGARAALRASVAETATALAKMAEEDMERKVFLTFVDNLRDSIGPEKLEMFCQENGLEVPEEGTEAETLLLLRINAVALGMSRYRETLTQQVIKVTQGRARMEGDIAMSKMHAEMLPALINAKKYENPLQQKLWQQKVGHTSAMIMGTVGAFASGIVVGALGGVYYGGEAAWEGVTKRLGKGIKNAAQGTSNFVSDRVSGFKDWANH